MHIKDINMKKIEFFEIYMKTIVSEFTPTGIIYFDKNEALKHVENENKNNINTGMVFTFEKITKSAYDSYTELKQENEKDIVL